MNEVVSTSSSSLLALIHRLAQDKEFDAAKFNLLLDRHQALLKEHQRQQFEISYVRMQGKIEGIKRTGKNPTFSAPYAKLEDLDEAARPAYVECGFGVRYGTEESPKGKDWIRGTLTLAHEAGYWEKYFLDGPIDYQHGARARTPIQAVGSSVTYLQRYLLRMALNLIAKNNPDDDDGEAIRASVDEFKKEAIAVAKTGKEKLVAWFKASTKIEQAWLKEWEKELREHYPPEEAKQ